MARFLPQVLVVVVSALSASACGDSTPANPLVDLGRYTLADETPASNENTGTPSLPSEGALASRPNLILIMTDDQAMGDLAAMPELLGGLREQGVAFARSFATWPLCCPSRVTMLTGQYPHNHRVFGNDAPEGGHSAFTNDAETLPVWLQRAGYRTAHIGKYLNGYGADNRGSTYVPPGWDRWSGLIDPSTYGMWGYSINHDGVVQTYGELDDEDPALYQTDVLRDLALDFIDAGIHGGQPFFLNLAFLAPHDERPEAAPESRLPGPRPAPRHVGAFAGVMVPRPLSFGEADLSDKPRLIRAMASANSSEPHENLESRYRRRLESLLAVDEAVAAILDRLKALGILDQTYIVFTADNGWFNGEHGVHAGKHLLYEPSVRVPLLMRGPGLAVGTSHELVANVDLAPTLLDLAGATAAGPVIDGRSVVPYARDLTLRSGRPILLDVPVKWRIGSGPGGLPAMLGLRTRDRSYVEWDTGEVELYDLDFDPGQLQSMHDDSQTAAERALLHDALSHYASCAGNGCRDELPARR